MNMTRMIVLVAWLAGSLAAASIPTQDLLRRSGKAAERFVLQFSDATCTENVRQEKLGPKGRVLDHLDSSYDYLVLMRLGASDIAVEESRIAIRQPGKSKGLSLLETSGFSLMAFIFHPYFQNSFEYTEPRLDSLDGKPALRVDFEHIRGRRSPSVLRLRNRDYPLEWKGTAWFEPASFNVVRMTATLKDNMEDVGLRAVSVDVRCAAVRFSGDAEDAWMPSIATIEAETPRQHWRNVMRFSNYRHFSVNTSTAQSGPPVTGAEGTADRADPRH